MTHAPTPSALASTSWWRDVLERAIRNALQVLLPVIALAAGGRIDGVTIVNGLAVAGLAAFASVLKALTPFNTGSLLERAVGAAAGAVLAVLPLDLAGVLALDYRALLTSILGSVLLALVAGYVTPPGAVLAAQGTDGAYRITPAPTSRSLDAGDNGSVL